MLAMAHMSLENVQDECTNPIVIRHLRHVFSDQLLSFSVAAAVSMSHRPLPSLPLPDHLLKQRPLPPIPVSVRPLPAVPAAVRVSAGGPLSPAKSSKSQRSEISPTSKADEVERTLVQTSAASWRQNTSRGFAALESAASFGRVRKDDGKPPLPPRPIVLAPSPHHNYDEGLCVIFI